MKQSWFKALALISQDSTRNTIYGNVVANTMWQIKAVGLKSEILNRKSSKGEMKKQKQITVWAFESINIRSIKWKVN